MAARCPSCADATAAISPGSTRSIWGIPFDAATSNRPGARFGPQAIRRASAIFDGDPQYPFGFDPFATLTVVDYGDCAFDYGRPGEISAAIEAQAAAILASGAQLFSLGGDHFVTYPLLKAHAAVHGPLALVQFDAHQDTWPDAGDRIDHGTFVGRAVREGLIEPSRSIQIGIRTQAPEDCRRRDDPRRRDRPARRPRRDRAHQIACRRGQGLSDLRHRLSRSGLCAGHRHAGRRRPVEPRGARRSCAGSTRSTSPAATSSRSRRPTITPTSPRSRRQPSPCSISACWRSGDEAADDCLATSVLFRIRRNPMSSKIRIGVLGASGYTGADLVRLALLHPSDGNHGADRQQPRRQADGRGVSAFRFRRPAAMLTTVDEADWSSVDAVFCGLPHGTTQEITKAVLAKHPGLKFIDMSADFRLRDPEAYKTWYGHEHQALALQGEAVYGLTEHYRDGHRRCAARRLPGLLSDRLAARPPPDRRSRPDRCRRHHHRRQIGRLGRRPQPQAERPLHRGRRGHVALFGGQAPSRARDRAGDLQGRAAGTSSSTSRRTSSR